MDMVAQLKNLEARLAVLEGTDTPEIEPPPSYVEWSAEKHKQLDALLERIGALEDRLDSISYDLALVGTTESEKAKDAEPQEITTAPFRFTPTFRSLTDEVESR